MRHFDTRLPPGSPTSRGALIALLLLTIAMVAQSGLGQTVPDRTEKARQGDAVIRVGSGPACDATDLLTAIEEAPSGTFLEVEGGRTFFGSDSELNSGFRVLSKSLVIAGGFSASCDGTRNGELTRLRPGRSQQRVIETSGAGGPYFLDLVGVDLSTGEHPFVGGGLFVNNATVVSLIDSFVSDNEAPSGGGIGLFGSSGGEVFLAGSTLSQNVAAVGAGIFCDDGSVDLAGALISGNSASIHGGGLFSSDCTVRSVSIPASVNLFFQNEAPRGGAIAASGSSDVRLSRTREQRQLLLNNSATEDGGAVHFDDNATLTLDGAEVAYNGAVRGGAFFATGSANLFLRGWDPSSPAAGCGRGPCTNWSFNFADLGGVLYVEEAGGALLATGLAEGNQAQVGPIAWVGETGTVVLGSVVARESVGLAAGAALVEAAGTVVVQHLTSANQNGVETIFRAGAGATLAVRNSIIWESAGTRVYAQDGVPAQADFECNLVHDTTGLPANHVGTVIGDPLFQALLDQHLESESPAVGLCTWVAGSDQDFDGEGRGTGAVDAGADQFHGIFNGGFETGDLGRWSASAGGP